MPRRILVITGAGVSAESGLPTYRGSDGLWRRRSPYELATRDAFESEPETVWEWYRERRAALSRAEPNSAHRALARLGREIPGALPRPIARSLPGRRVKRDAVGVESDFPPYAPPPPVPSSRSRLPSAGVVALIGLIVSLLTSALAFGRRDQVIDNKVDKTELE